MAPALVPSSGANAGARAFGANDHAGRRGAGRALGGRGSSTTAPIESALPGAEPGDRLMNASVISVLAALAGATIGGLTSVLTSWLTQQMQARTQQFARDLGRRQKLYKDFIEEASKSYIDALQHDKADVSSLVGLYAKISRMRVLS
jgi:hypothetical protein